MIEIETDFIKRYFTVLEVIYGQKIINYSYPPFFGARDRCFHGIKEYDQLRPANGLELSILFYGIRRAINSGNSYYDREWEKLWEKLSGNESIPVIVPARNLWIPIRTFEDDSSLSGILVDTSTQRAWNSEKMQIPNLTNSENWKQNEKRIYVSNDKDLKFIPKGEFKLGRHTKSSFIKDNYTQSVFTRRGAEIIASLTYEIGLDPYLRGLDNNSILGEESFDNPIQRDTLLIVGKKELALDCQHLSLFHRYFLFGVFKEKKDIHRIKIEETSKLKEL